MVPWADVARCSGQASARRETGAPAGPRLGNPGAAICFFPHSCGHTHSSARVCAGPRGHTRHPAVHTHSSARLSQACACAHIHTHTVMHRHQGTLTNTQSLCMAKTPLPHLSPLQLSESFTPGARPGRHPFFLGPTFSKPLSPTLSGPATHPFLWVSPIQKHTGCGTARGAGEGAAINPLPPRFPSLPTPALGPLPPKTRRLPPTRWPFLLKPEGWGGLGRI